MNLKMNNNSQMDVVFSSDTNYIMPAGVMMTSVSLNNKDADITFHALIDGSVKEKQKQQLETIVAGNGRHHIKFYLMDASRFVNLPMLGEIKLHITQATYYRLFLTEILPVEIEKVLYLDGDIVVMGSLKELWETNIDECSVGCVTDMSEAVHDYSRLGYSSDFGYFNAGVLLINLKYWRENKVVDSFWKIMSETPERIRLHDQDVLNICFYNSKKPLALKYNLQDGFLYKKDYWEVNHQKYENCIQEAIKQPVIIHYIARKPWFVGCENPFKNEWLYYLKKTQWRRYKLKRKKPYTFKNRVGKILRFMHLLPQFEQKDSMYRLL